MIKLFIIIVSIFVPAILIFMNVTHPVHGGIIFSIFISIVTLVKIWESFFTSKEKDRSHYHGDWTLLLTSLLYFLAGIFIVTELFVLNREINIYVTIGGLLIFSLAALIRRWSIKTLGNQWAIHAVGQSKLLDKHVLVIVGPYKYVRHPIYTSYILDLLGLALIFNAYYSIIFIVVVNIYSYVIRAMHEERHSLNRFGSQYTEYKDRSSFMIPFFKINKK